MPIQLWVRRTRDNQGSTLLEYSLVLILFLTLVFGMTGFAQFLYAYHFVNYAARDAARWAAVNGGTCNTDASCNGKGGMDSQPATASDIETYVKNIAPPGIDTSNTNSCDSSATLDVCATWPVESGSDASPAGCSNAATKNYPGCTVQVQVQYKYNFVFPLIRTSPVTLTSTSQMVISH
jgi:Flp pilus assembly protein TadG